MRETTYWLTNSNIMKKTVIFLFAMFMAAATFAQGGKDLYNRYSGKDGVSAVYISPAMFELIKQIPDIEIEGGETFNLSEIIKTFDGMYILEIENAELASEVGKNVAELVEKDRYSLIMEAVDGGDRVHVYIVREGDTVTDFLMLASEKGAESTGGSTAVISISAKMAMSELQKLMASAMQ